jgi:hypothetical protein|tara:strand:+ start:199 stop:630 length:432 start_codon:yes stop_codon:yes gene_type:complete
MHNQNPHVAARAQPHFAIQIDDGNGGILQATPGMIARMMQQHKALAIVDIDCAFLTHLRGLVQQVDFHHTKYALIGDFIAFMEEINQTTCRACGALGHCSDVCPTYAKMTTFSGTNPFFMQLCKEFIGGGNGGNSSVSGANKD